MEESARPERLVFGEVADAYDRARPGFPAEAARWLVGAERARVVELGAGTGKLTVELAGQGHRVLATDPSAPMLAHLRRTVPAAWVAQAAAEAIPVATSAVDVVVAAQSFHWFDHPVALAEIARVLRAGGALGLVWNHRDESVPWVRRLSGIIGGEPLSEGPSTTLLRSGLFGVVEHRRFRFWQHLDRERLLDLVRSRSYVAVLPDAERSALLDKVSALYDGYGRGPDGMSMPYVTECFRTHVTARAKGQRPDSNDGLLVDFS